MYEIGHMRDTREVETRGRDVRIRSQIRVREPEYGTQPNAASWLIPRSET